MRLNITLFFFVLLDLHPFPGNFWGQSPYAAAYAAAVPLWTLEFTDLSDTVRTDLLNLGFALEKQMANELKIHLAAADGGLKIATSGQAFGFMVKKNLYIDGAELLEIEWGVDRYPDGADWRQGKNYESLMVILFFGDPLPRGHLFLPDVPLFIGMFLGRHEPPLQPYISDSYPKTGRYVCLGNPEPGQAITSTFPIARAFRQWFDGREMPPVTGIAIEVDTGELPIGATSSAFIKSISLGRAE